MNGSVGGAPEKERCFESKNGQSGYKKVIKTSNVVVSGVFSMISTFFETQFKEKSFVSADVVFYKNLGFLMVSQVKKWSSSEVRYDARETRRESEELR